MQVHLVRTVLEQQDAMNKTFLAFKNSAGNSLSRSPSGSGLTEILNAALEPAAPYINLMDSSVWVNKTDANFVDVLHTNSAPLFLVRFYVLHIVKVSLPFS